MAFRLIFVMSISLLAICKTSTADEDDVMRKLKTSIEQYEKVEEKLRNEIHIALMEKKKSALNAGNLNAVEAIEAELKGFETDHKLPKLVSTLNYEATLVKEHANLEQVYKATIKSYTTDGKLENARAVREELLEFMKVQPIGKQAKFLETELLRNPGAEQALIQGRIPEWTCTQGVWGTRSADPAPNEGKFYFQAGKVPVAELAQDISLAAVSKLILAQRLEISFKGTVRSFDQPNPDSAQVIIEFHDTNKKVLERYDSGKIENVRQWEVVSVTRIVPKGTKSLRVRLISTRSEGNDNDGYFDSLSLMAFAPVNKQTWRKAAAK
jgi:hypothetical protein